MCCGAADPHFHLRAFRDLWSHRVMARGPRFRPRAQALHMVGAARGQRASDEKGEKKRAFWGLRGALGVAPCAQKRWKRHEHTLFLLVSLSFECLLKPKSARPPVVKTLPLGVDSSSELSETTRSARSEAFRKGVRLRQLFRCTRRGSGLRDRGKEQEKQAPGALRRDLKAISSQRPAF